MMTTQTFSPLRSALLVLPVAVMACSDSGLPTGTDPVPATETAPSFAEEIPNYWTTRTNMPIARKGMVAATVNGIIYVIGGWNSSGARISRVDAYKPGTSTLVAWTPRASLPSPRGRPNGAVAINGKIYVAGGVNSQGDATGSLYVYDIAGNYWVAKAQMPVASWGGISAGMDGKLYVLATMPGEDGNFTGPSRLFRYSPATNSWVELAPAPHHHHQGVARVIDGKLYVAGGLTYVDDDITPMAPKAWGHLDVYDPATNTWISKASMPRARFGGASGVLDGKLYVAGGWTGKGSPVPTLELYNPLTNAWSSRVDMPTARGYAAGSTAGGRLHVLGGMGGNETVLSKNESYNP
jgi:N-acetylneuraminic acid mutarotase